MSTSTRQRPAPRYLVMLLAVICGLAVAKIYFAQPLLDTIADNMGLGPAAAGLLVTVTQVGYAAGLILLVPIGDLIDRRRLIGAQLLLSVFALISVSAATSTGMLFAGMAAVGVLAVVIQVVVAYAASLAAPSERGRVVGSVTSGVVAGILVARTLAGAVALTLMLAA